MLGLVVALKLPGLGPELAKQLHACCWCCCCCWKNQCHCKLHSSSCFTCCSNCCRCSAFLLSSSCSTSLLSSLLNLEPPMAASLLVSSSASGYCSSRSCSLLLSFEEPLVVLPPCLVLLCLSPPQLCQPWAGFQLSPFELDHFLLPHHSHIPFPLIPGVIVIVFP